MISTFVNFQKKAGIVLENMNVPACLIELFVVDRQDQIIVLGVFMQ